MVTAYQNRKKLHLNSIAKKLTKYAYKKIKICVKMSNKY